MKFYWRNVKVERKLEKLRKAILLFEEPRFKAHFSTLAMLQDLLSLQPPSKDSGSGQKCAPIGKFSNFD